MEKDKVIYAGCDPAFRKSGFCLCFIEGSDVAFITFPAYEDFIDWVYRTNIGNIVVCIENSNRQNVSFDKTGNASVISRKSRNVGMNQAASELAARLFAKRGALKVVELSAKGKGKKLSLAEFSYTVDANRHKLINERKNTSQDKRDAYKLALLAQKIGRQI